jgi:signal transduction histidine kinase
MSEPVQPRRSRRPTAVDQDWPLVTHIVPYVLLVALAGFMAATGHLAGRPLMINLALCAACAIWMLSLFTLHPAWRGRPTVMAVFLAGFVAIWLVLVLRDPWFGCFAPAGYLFAFRVLPFPVELPGVAAAAVVAATAQASTVDKGTAAGMAEYGVVVAINVVPMCGLSWFGWRIGTSYAERELALEQAREANRRLEATLTENAGLHEQLVTQAREAGILDERQRMAREIHDTLAQGLTGIVTQLQAAEQAAADPGRWQRHFRAATRLARDSLAEARRSVDALRPEPLETARLGDALAAVAERWSSLHGIPVQVATTGEARPLRPDAEFALLRTAQEALANVAKHARAGRVGLTLSYLEHEVALDVRDDGKGFDTAGGDGSTTGSPTARRAGGGGFGLVAMRQRIEGVRGTLQIESEPGGGTAVSARVLLVPAEARS